ncbi:MAG TPA: superoxide dismutase family protein [Novosphingobium sp.]|nr:superoxide dismutase family protein [Novosphingobium sp.]
MISRSPRFAVIPAAALAFVTMTACAHAEGEHAHAPASGGVVTPAPAAVSSMVEADVVGLDGKTLGKVVLQQIPAGVLVSADVKGIPAGEHGFHFHQKGICDPAAKFETSAGHFTGGDHQHGYLVAQGPHGGDMPNQHVGADGVLKTQILNTGVTLGSGPKSLFDADGTALVIHAGADDYTSQPSGNAGGRIACAVIAKAK